MKRILNRLDITFGEPAVKYARFKLTPILHLANNKIGAI
jgi:hypothetical protein